MPVNEIPRSSGVNLEQRGISPVPVHRFNIPPLAADHPPFIRVRPAQFSATSRDVQQALNTAVPGIAAGIRDSFTNGVNGGEWGRYGRGPSPKGGLRPGGPGTDRLTRPERNCKASA